MNLSLVDESIQAGVAEVLVRAVRRRSTKAFEARRIGTRLLVIQPSPYCNINCDYCYLPDRDNRHKMPIKTLTNALNSLQDAGLNRGGMTVLWHGGEPFALPPSYYSEAFAAVRSCQGDYPPVRLAVQSNGIGISDELCKTLLMYSVSVGISIDGPKSLHDSHRKTRRGTGSFDLSMRGFEMLRRHGLATHVICVVTNETLADPDNFFDFFRSLGVKHLCLNFEEKEAANSKSTLQYDACKQKLNVFLSRLYELGLKYSHPKIREFDDIESALFNPRTNNDLSWPFDIVSVASNGSFSTFSPELLGWTDNKVGGFSFGNVNQGGLVDGFDSERFDSIWSEVSRGVENCKSSCGLYSLCGGGAPSNKIAELGTLDGTETEACKFRIKIVSDIILNSLTEQPCSS